MITVPNAGSERLHEQFGFRRVGVLLRRWMEIRDAGTTSLTGNSYYENDEAAPVSLKSVSEVDSPAQ